MKAIFAITVFVACVVSASADMTCGFYVITPGATSGQITTVQNQLQMEVLGTPGEAFVTFRFVNLGPEASSICDVYFDDGALLGSAMSISGSDGVAFSTPAKPEELPDRTHVSPAFQTSQSFSADSDPPVESLGVDQPGEWLDITFALVEDEGGHQYVYEDVLSSLESLALRVGIHVQGFSPSGSVSAINNPQPIPLPAAIVLGALGLGGLACVRSGLRWLRA